MHCSTQIENSIKIQEYFTLHILQLILQVTVPSSVSLSTQCNRGLLLKLSVECKGWSPWKSKPTKPHSPAVIMQQNEFWAKVTIYKHRTGSSCVCVTPLC